MPPKFASLKNRESAKNIPSPSPDVSTNPDYKPLQVPPTTTTIPGNNNNNNNNSNKNPLPPNLDQTSFIHGHADTTNNKNPDQHSLLGASASITGQSGILNQTMGSSTAAGFSPRTSATTNTAPSPSNTASPASPAVNPPPIKALPKYKEETLVTFAPHVTLVKRTSVDQTTGALNPNQTITFVRKTIQAPDRAKRELEHLRAQCRHPNVLKYLSGTKHRNGVVDIDMEFADGGQLDSVLTRVNAGKDRVRAAKCCARQVLSGLVYYNQVHGRCHRDVKPANFLVRCDGVIKVSDFDVSKETSFGHPGSAQQQQVVQPHSNSGKGENTVLGTAPYMSPELVLGALNVSPMLSDIWSVGVTIFQLLEGQLPFAKFKFGTFMIPNDDHIRKLSWDVVKDDRALEFLLRRCLVINPEHRITLSEATALTFVLMNDDDAEGIDDTNPWSKGYADAEDENVKVARELNVAICDDVIRANRCVPPKYAPEDAAGDQVACLVYDAAEYEAVNAKIRAAADAVQKELRSWKEVRANPELRDKVDRVMKEVCRMRCEKVWNQLVGVAPWLSNS